MKRFPTILLALPAILVTNTFADEAGEKVLRQLDAAARPSATRSLVRQTIRTSGGAERAFTLEICTSADEEELLLVYTEPARVKGVSFLMLNGRSDTWTFNPKTRRVRKLTSSTQKRRVNGSDFTYEDFGDAGKMGEDYSADYDGEETLEGELCDRIVLVPKPGGPSYSKVIAWVSREPRVVRRADYYDEEGEELKRLIATDVRLVDGAPTPHDLLMKSLRGDRSTRMQLVEVERNLEFNGGIFTLDHLQGR